jgi:hypothetical protein
LKGIRKLQEVVSFIDSCSTWKYGYDELDDNGDVGVSNTVEFGDDAFGDISLESVSTVTIATIIMPDDKSDNSYILL